MRARDKRSDMATEYQVTWEIEITAETRHEAAEAALEIMQDPASLATVFRVVDTDTGFNEQIDLGA